VFLAVKTKKETTSVVFMSVVASNGFEHPPGCDVEQNCAERKIGSVEAVTCLESEMQARSRGMKTLFRP